MQLVADNILRILGAKTSLVYVQSTKSTIAQATGLRVNVSLPFLGIEPPAVVGVININEKLLSKHFTDSEISFILAHECVHIFNNHVISTLFWNILETALKGEKNENYDIVEVIKTIFALFSQSHLPPNAETLRDQEYEADRIAVSITGDLQSAISCLSKLVRNNMTAPSHTWELFSTTVPAMTMGQRIQALREGMQFI